jgi:pimeloyl-ACP methyl ester carboxylesterase
MEPLPLIATAVAALGGLALLLFAFTVTLTVAVGARYPRVGHLVDLGPGRLHVVETAPRAPMRGTVLLVHGASGNFADPHVALSERLAELGFRVFSVDRPGHGCSDRLGGRGATSPRRQAAWIREALGTLGARDAIVVVHSLAGVLGLAMALESRSFTRGLVLLAPVSHPWPGGVSWYYTLGAHRWLGAPFRWLLVAPAGLALMPSALRATFAPNSVPPDYQHRTRLPLVLRPWHFRANAEDFVDLHDETVELSPRYADIVAPAAIVMGAEDRLVSADLHARALARALPNATLRLLPGIGHSPHFAAPDEVVAAILSVERRAQGETVEPSAAAAG